MSSFSTPTPLTATPEPRQATDGHPGAIGRFAAVTLLMAGGFNAS